MAGNLQEPLLVAEKPDPDSGVLDSSFTTNPHSYTPLRELADADRADEAAAAKSRCVKQPYCGGAVKLWCLRSTQDRVLLALTSALVFCLICATILLPIVNELTHEAVNSALVVDSPNSEAYDSWASNTQDDAPVLHYDFHIFDITNENEMLLEGAKPKLIERGPYAYKKMSEKFDIEWHNHGEYVSFYTQTYYVWDSSRAAPGLDPETDMITSPYVVAIGLKALVVDNLDLVPDFLEKVHEAIPEARFLTEGPLKGVMDEIFHGEGWRALVKTLMCLSAGHASPVRDFTPNELMWGYFQDPMLSLVGKVLAKVMPDMPWSTFVPGMENNYTDYDDARRRVNKDLVHTGKRHIEKIGQYVKYQNMTHEYFCLTPYNGDDESETPPACHPYETKWDSNPDSTRADMWFPAWATVEANEIKGTAGDFYAPQSDPTATKDRVTFVDDLYRTCTLGHERTYTWKGIKLHRVGIRDVDLRSSNCDLEPNCVPENADYFAFGRSGILNFTAIATFPYFATKPHFLDADPWYIEQLQGLYPQEDIHDTYIDVEPFSGYTLRGAKRLQLVTGIDDWSMPSLPFYEYYHWNSDVINNAKKKVIEKVVAKVEEVIKEDIVELVEEKVEQFCEESREKHQERCWDFELKIDAFIESKCAEADDDHVAGKVCDAYDVLRKMVNSTDEPIVDQIAEFCDANLGHKAECDALQFAFHEAITIACNHANSTLANVACEYGPIVVQDVRTLWQDLRSFCGAGACEAVEFVREEIATHDVRNRLTSHCNASLVRREENCAKADDFVNEKLAEFCAGNGTYTKDYLSPSIAGKVCGFLNTSIYHPGTIYDNVYQLCNSGTIAQKLECKTARGVISSKICNDDDGNKLEPVCEIAHYLIDDEAANWKVIDAKILEGLDDWHSFCTHDLCERVDTWVYKNVIEYCNATLHPTQAEECDTIKAKIHDTVNATCHDHPVPCQLVEDLVVHNLSYVVKEVRTMAREEIEELYDQVQAWCGDSKFHTGVCDEVRGLAKELALAALEKLLEALGLGPAAEKVEEAYTCMASPSNFTIPHEGWFMPIAWISEHRLVVREYTATTSYDFLLLSVSPARV